MSENIFKNLHKKPKEFKNPSGWKTSNCLRCGKEVLERDMIRKALKTSQPNAISGGDLLLLCKGCHNGSGE